MRITTEELEEMMHMQLHDIPLATPETLTIEYLEKLIVELEDQGNSDPECAHMLESAAMISFIENVASNKYTTEEARVIAELLLQIRDMPFPRWFA
jgi:hypothetical protein